MKKLKRIKKYPLFFPRVLRTILEFYDFLAEPGKKKKHDCREVYTVLRWQGSVTRTEPTSVGASLTAATQHHYVPPLNLFVDVLGDREDMPPVVSLADIVFSSLNSTTALPVSPGSSFTPTMVPPLSAGYI